VFQATGTRFACLPAQRELARRIGLFLMWMVIGVVLIADGFGHHVPKGDVYFAMAFSMGVELLNIRLRGRRGVRPGLKPRRPSRPLRAAAIRA
jgi:predicted tellurium resistance membrane protein TerC